MENQLSLNDFIYHPSGKYLPPTILKLLEQGFGRNEIARKLGVKPSSISYHLEKLREKGLVLHEKRVWLYNYTAQNTGTEVVERGGWGVASGKEKDVAISSKSIENPVWEVHHVQGYAKFKREGNWGWVEKYCHPSTSSKGNWVFRRGDVSLVFRRKSVQVTVHGLHGLSLGSLHKRAWERARSFLGLVERDSGFKFGVFSWRSDVHWTLNERLSQPLLAFKPSLADSSHPNQVELHEPKQVDALAQVLNGELLRRIDNLERVNAELQLVVRAQVVALERLVSKLEV